MAELSRMEKLEERQNMRRVGILAGITIVLVLAAFLVGIPLMVRLAIWWGASRPPVEKTDLIPPVPPSILLSYGATNSAVQRISGTVEPGATIALGLNRKPVGNVVAGDDGSWDFANVTLQEGDNTFVAVAVDSAGNKSPESDPVNMKYLSKSPELTLDSPSDHQVVTGKTGLVDVKGTTIPNGRLTVNDRVIILNSAGKFATTYQLGEGENVLVFVVSDQSGNQTRKELVVEYQK